MAKHLSQTPNSPFLFQMLLASRQSSDCLLDSVIDDSSSAPQQIKGLVDVVTFVKTNTRTSITTLIKAQFLEKVLQSPEDTKV